MLAIVWRAFLVLPCPEDMGGLPPPSRGCLGRLLLGVGLVHWKKKKKILRRRVRRECNLRRSLGMVKVRCLPEWPSPLPRPTRVRAHRLPGTPFLLTRLLPKGRRHVRRVLRGDPVFTELHALPSLPLPDPSPPSSTFSSVAPSSSPWCSGLCLP